MKMNQIYIGIPSKIKSLIFWISREYRKNDLSFEIGGADIIIEYTNGKIFGYDWIKYPGRYVKKIFNQSFLKDESLEEIELIKQNVSRIFARKYDADKYDIEAFAEVWNNNNSDELPYSKLDKFTVDLYSGYLQLFLNNIDFAKQYISIHYPFTYDFLINNWSFIETGTAHYCVFLSDTDWVYPSKFGLCYNKNIRWNSKLRARFEYGFDNPYLGYVEGTGMEPVEYCEREYLDTIIPLSKEKEIECRDYILFQTSSSFEDFEFNLRKSEDVLFDFKHLNLPEFKTIFEKSKLAALVNESVWENTLQFIIDDNFCDIIIDKLKRIEIEQLKAVL